MKYKYKNYCLRYCVVLICLTVAVVIVNAICDNKVYEIIETARWVSMSDMAMRFGDMYTSPRIVALQSQLNAWWPVYAVFHLLRSCLPIITLCACVFNAFFWRRINRALNIRRGALYVKIEEMVGIVKKRFKIGREYAIKLLLEDERVTFILSDHALYAAVKEGDVVIAMCDVDRLTVNDETRNMAVILVTTDQHIFTPKSLGSV